MRHNNQTIANIFGVTGSYPSFLDFAPCNDDDEPGFLMVQPYHTYPIAKF